MEHDTSNGNERFFLRRVDERSTRHNCQQRISSKGRFFPPSLARFSHSIPSVIASVRDSRPLIIITIDGLWQHIHICIVLGFKRLSLRFSVFESNACPVPIHALHSGALILLA